MRGSWGKGRSGLVLDGASVPPPPTVSPLSPLSPSKPVPSSNAPPPLNPCIFTLMHHPHTPQGFSIVLKLNGRVGQRAVGLPNWDRLAGDVERRRSRGLDVTNI